jgi:hypothetical protein
MNPTEVFDNTAPFRANEERRNQISTEPLQVMRDIPQPDPSRGVLSAEQTEAAAKDLIDTQYIFKYPKASTFSTDPAVPQQRLGLISFIPAKGAIPDKQGAYGVVKIRGNYSTVNEATAQAERLIREIDSLSEIDVAFVGRWYPLLADNSMYTASTQEIDIRTTVVDSTVKDHFVEKRKKEEKEMREVEQRVQRLRDPTHQHEKENALEKIELYTSLRVKRANALQALDEYKSRIEQANIILESTEKEIAAMDSEFPDYKDEYIERYKAGLNAIGAELAQNPLMKYLGVPMKESENTA